MIKIIHETYSHWTTGDYFDWALNHHQDDFSEYQKIYKEKDMTISIEPNYDGNIYWALDNHRLMNSIDHAGGRWRNANILFYTQPKLKYYFASLNKHSYCIPFAADPELHRPYDFDKIYDVGIIMQADGKRGEFVNEVMYKSGLKWLNISAVKTPWEYSWNLSQCKILFNKSREGEVNMRFFEGMSIGPLVTDKTSDLHLFAEDGVHFISYDGKSVEGAIRTIYSLLKNDKKRAQVAHDSRILIKEKHTYKQRLKDMLKIIKEVSV